MIRLGDLPLLLSKSRGARVIMEWNGKTIRDGCLVVTWSRLIMERDKEECLQIELFDFQMMIQSV